MTEIHITITRQPDGELRVRTQGTARGAHEDEVELGKELVAAVNGVLLKMDGESTLHVDTTTPSIEMGDD